MTLFDQIRQWRVTAFLSGCVGMLLVTLIGTLVVKVVPRWLRWCRMLRWRGLHCVMPLDIKRGIDTKKQKLLTIPAAGLNPRSVRLRRTIMNSASKQISQCLFLRKIYKDSEDPEPV